MERNIPQLPLPLTKVYIISLIIIALVATTSQVFVHTQLNKTLKEGAVVTMLRQQRVQVQEIINTSLLIRATPDVIKREQLAQQLKGQINSWDQVHKVLRFGKSSGQAPLTGNTPETEPLMEKADPAFREIRRQANRTVVFSSGKPEELENTIAVMMAQEPVFTGTMTRLAGFHEERSNTRVAHLQNLEIVLYVITLLVLVLEGVFIFRPTVHRISYYIDQMIRTAELTAELNTQLEEKTAEQDQARERLQDILNQQRALITQHQRTEKELLEKQRFITAMTQATPDVLYVLDLAEGKNIFTNRKVTDISGLLPEEVMQMDRTALATMVHPEDLERYKDQKRKIRVAGDDEMHGVEFRIRHKNGYHVWLHCQEVVFARDEAGKVTQVLGIAQDITETKSNQEALKVSEEKYRSLIEKADDIIYENGAEGYFTYLNPVASKLLGYTKEEFLRMPCWNVIKPGYRKEATSFYQKQAEYKALNSYYEVPVISKDGNEIWLGQNATFEYKNDQLHAVRVIARDITRLRYAEQKIKESELRYRSVVNNIAEVVFQTDSERHWTFLNPAWMCITGFSEEESLGKEICRYIHPDDQARSEAVFGLIIRQEKDYVRHEIRFLTSSGEYKWVEIFAQLTLDARKNITGLSGTIMDISERKVVEDTLIRARDQAQEAVAAKQSFLSMMSHEIRTPMNAVIGMTHLLLQENPRADQLENLNILKFSADNLLVLINDILDYSKIEAGKIAFEEVDFNLRNLIGSVEQSMLYKAQEKNILLETSIDPKLPGMLIGDPVRLGQILNNLVSNAIKFTERGMVRIEATAGEITGDRAEIKIAVSDTGIGIPEDKLDCIFESFTQAGPDTTRKFGGTGLGLAITRRLLELQQSQIFVESVQDLGSRFHFTISFRRGAGGNMHHLPVFENQMAADLSHLRILLVEDNEVNTIVATKFLNQWGIQPDYATNGQIAVEMVQQIQYDLLLMDLQMPVMDGYTATRNIRTLKETCFQRLPIIALTASAMSDVKQKLLDIGMNDYVTKPFIPSELYNKIVYYTRGVGAEPEPAPGLPKARPGTIDLQAISEMAGDDILFRQRLIDVCIQTLQECKAVYQRALTAGDEQMLKALSHKMQPTLKILSANHLLEEIEKGKKLLQEQVNADDVSASIRRMASLCRDIVEELVSHPV